jgi:subfamily B ATP-binding cassette protein MsbA
MYKFKAFQTVFQGKNSWIFALFFIPNLIAACLEGLSFGFILLSFQILTKEKPSAIIPWLHKLSDHPSFFLLIIFAICTQILRSVFTYIGQISVLSFALKIQKSLQLRVYAQIFRFSFPFASKYKIGDLSEHVKAPAYLVNHLIEPFNRMIISGFTILISLIVMYSISPSLTLFLILLFGLFSYFQKWIIQKIAFISQKLTNNTVELSKQITQSLYGLKLIHTFARQSFILKKIQTTLDQIAAHSKQLNSWTQAISPINEMIGISLVGLFLILGQFFIDGKEGISMLVTFILIAHRLNGRLQTFLSSSAAIAFHWGPIIRLEEILNEKDKEFHYDSGFPISSFNQEIVFKDVSFTYPNTSLPVLQNLNFSLLKGKTTAFVGASGSGKSTIIDLIIHLYKASQGEITIDGLPIEKLNTYSWRNLLGVVSQDIVISPETIEENILFGNPSASPDELLLAAQLSGAHEFISQLPDQYQTLLGEKGYRLSGGEKQKIALTRALIRNPEILILDEASSNLDTHSELFIQKALSSLKTTKTILIIAHRLSTIKDADTIFVLEKGEIIESGSHDELMHLQGKYASFCEVQLVL